jgi:hypothetical protein
MKERPALTMWTALASGILAAAIIACNAPLRIGQMLESSEKEQVDSTLAPALLPNFQGDVAHLAATLPRYEIDLTVDFDALTLQGLSKVTYTNTESIPLDSLYFRLFPNGHKSYGDGSLTVTNTLVDGQAVETFSSLSDSVLEVRLPQALEAGDRTQISFQFSGVVPADFGSEPDSTGYGIYNKSNGVMALSGWYPLLAVYDEDGWNLDPVSAIGDSVYSETALYKVEVMAREDVVLASSGVQTATRVEGDFTRHFLVSGPVRDFFVILSPDFRRISKLVDGVLVSSYYLPGSITGGEDALAVTSQALHLFNTRYGSYPYGELDVVETPLKYAAGVEYPTIVLIGRDLYRISGMDLFADVVAHEVAHQWWYGVVGNDVFDDPWLDEALAMYSDGVYREETGGVAAYNGYLEYLDSEYSTLVKAGTDDQITQSLGHFEERGNPNIYSVVVYSKGALFFDAVRKEIGDEAFFKALKVYYQDHRYGVARPEDLLAAFEKAANRPLGDLYEKWLYSSGDG